MVTSLVLNLKRGWVQKPWDPIKPSKQALDIEDRRRLRAHLMYHLFDENVKKYQSTNMNHHKLQTNASSLEGGTGRKNVSLQHQGDWQYFVDIIL